MLMFCVLWMALDGCDHGVRSQVEDKRKKWRRLETGYTSNHMHSQNKDELELWASRDTSMGMDEPIWSIRCVKVFEHMSDR